MSQRQFPSSDGAGDLERALHSHGARIRRMEDGRHRGPGSSFGSPLLITNAESTVTWALAVDNLGQLVAYRWIGPDSDISAATVIATLP